MERSVVNLLAVLLTAILGALQPAVVVAGAALVDARARRTGILWAAAIAVGAGILFLGLALVAVPLHAVFGTVGPVLLAVGLVLAMVAALLLLVRRRSVVTGRVLGTIAVVLVGAGHILDSGPALFGLSSSVGAVLLGVVVGAVALLAVATGLSVAARRWPPVDLAVLIATLVATLTGLVQVVASLLHDLVGWAPHLSSVVTLGATLLAGLVALLVGVAVGWRPAQP